MKLLELISDVSLIVLASILVIILDIGVIALFVWAIGLFVVWVFKISFVWTFWHGLAASLIICLLSLILNKK